LQGSGPSDPETVQYQIGQPAEKRLPLSHLEIVHGRLKMNRMTRRVNEKSPHYFLQVLRLPFAGK
jgi:hypothetical protein